MKSRTALLRSADGRGDRFAPDRVPAKRISAVLGRYVVRRPFGNFGEARVNVLELNLDLQNA